jgi:alpha,alpha-trehalase
MEFLSLVLQEFLRHGTIFEKYDVARRTADLTGIQLGYHSNVVGFGWTNAVFTVLYDGFSPGEKRNLMAVHPATQSECRHPQASVPFH